MKTMIIPFDLKTALKVSVYKIKGHIVTRDGRRVTMVSTNVSSDPIYSVMCYYVMIDGDSLTEKKCYFAVTERGEFHKGTWESPSDLFIKLYV
jgi:hypothetical protein